ncbi:MAG: hypothetical protein QF567_00820 [Candidatus Pacearchaeota archaeon]|jgi:hypothetical protein|nr:hypothetical protein [Candidatus Pacearchaeota archaeon]|tara:strand:+ start:34806 stop:36266 length:1461 start_codon:yes stop_codon:yes gene_type:complete
MIVELNNMETILSIPTYRSQQIAITVNTYAQNFKRFNHTVPIFVFDDSNETQSKISEKCLLDLSKQLGNTQEINYVGPIQKQLFLENLQKRFGQQNARNIGRIFKPSYGGNRNFSLVYTLGKTFISVDDDIVPAGLFTNQYDTQLKEGIRPNIISKGSFMYEREIKHMKLVEQDVVKGYTKFLGTSVKDHSSKVRTGKRISDPDVDSLGVTTGKLEDRVMKIVNGRISPEARIKVVQTHLSGDADMDSADLINLFVETGVGDILSGRLPKKYIIEKCREAITFSNERLTGAVLGYDNSEGAIYFLPTNFRCEDFIWRVHLEKRLDIASAYTEHVQTHNRSLLVRESISQDWFNELIAQRLKRRIRDSIKNVGRFSMEFHTPYGVSLETAKDIKRRIEEKYNQATKKIKSNNKSSVNYQKFVQELEFILENEIISPKKFANKLTKVVLDEFSLFNKTAKIWPKILEYVSEMKEDLPILNLTKESLKN